MIAPGIRGLFCEQRDLRIYFFFFPSALISLMYVNVAGRTVCLELTSMDVTSPLNLEREAGMGDAGRGAQPPRRSAPLPGEMSTGSSSSLAPPPPPRGPAALAGGQRRAELPRQL